MIAVSWNICNRHDTALIMVITCKQSIHPHLLPRKGSSLNMIPHI